MVIHQAFVVYDDGAKTRFVSRDGEYFYEHQFPEKNSRFSPLRYHRQWLKDTAQMWDGIKSIEFTETES